MGDILALRLHINKIYNHDYGNSDRRPSLAAVMAILARLNLCSAGTNISQSQGNSGFMTLQNAQSFCASREEVIEPGSLLVTALSLNARGALQNNTISPFNEPGRDRNDVSRHQPHRHPKPDQLSWFAAHRPLLHNAIDPSGNPIWGGNRCFRYIKVTIFACNLT